MLHKIHYKIAVAAGFCILIAVISLALIVANRNQSLQTEVMHMVGEELSQKAGAELLTLAEIQAQKVSNELTHAMGIARGLADTMQSFLLMNRTDLLDREAFSQYTKSVLENNETILGTYIAWEAGIGDGQDELFIGQNHTHDSGQYAPYWNRSSSGSIAVRPLNLTLVYENEAKGNPGGASDWYLCPEYKKRPCLIDPYTWEVQGKTVIGTSLVLPLLDGNNFIGMTGVDIGLDFLQGLALQGDGAFYSGAGRILFLAPNGLLAADSNDESNIGKALTQVEKGLLLEASKSNTAQILSSETHYYALAPITAKGAPEQWNAIIEIDKSVVLAGVARTGSLVSESFASTLWALSLIATLIAAISMVVMSVLAKSISSPIEKTAIAMEQLASNDGDLTRRIKIKRDDELGKLSSSLDAFLQKTHGIVKDIAGEMDNVENTVSVTNRLSDQTNSGMQAQKQELELVSVAINEMSATAAEVAKSAAHTAEATNTATSAVHSGNNKVQQNLNSIGDLVEDMGKAATVIQRLSEDSANISNIVNVINGISEQTNLLALNAAIEAARAGEQGRGFAVVADEVRSLAAKTQQSTGEIQSLIDRLQSCTSEAVNAIQLGQDKSGLCIDQAQQAVEALQGVVSEISRVDEMTTQIAGAAEEQRCVAEDITRNVNTISDVANDVAEGAAQSQRENAHVLDSMFALKDQLNRFRY